MGLSDSERISMIRSAVLIQYTRGVTDGQTDGRNWRGIYAVARKNNKRRAVAAQTARSRCKFQYALFGDYRHIRASRLHESESVDSSILN